MDFYPKKGTPHEVEARTSAEITTPKSLLARQIRRTAEMHKQIVCSVLSPTIHDVTDADRHVLYDAYHQWFDSQDTREGIDFLLHELTSTDVLSPYDKHGVDRFISDMRHDLNVFYQPMEGLIDPEIMLLAGWPDMYDPLLISYPQRIYERTARLVSEDPLTEYFSPQESIELMRSVFERHFPGLAIHIESHSSHVLVGDPLYFEGIIFNIVRNAEKALQYLGERQPDPEIHILMEEDSICIEDNGTGFPEELLIVEGGRQKAFVRGVVGSIHIAGTGLGLDIAHTLQVDHLKGEIALSNVVRDGHTKGARVTLLYPHVGAAGLEPATSRPPA